MKISIYLSRIPAQAAQKLTGENITACKHFVANLRALMNSIVHERERSGRSG